jgi:hypothetical protein
VYEVFWWVLIIKVGNFAKGKYAYDIFSIKSREKILKSSFEFEYLRKLVLIICAVVLLDIG